MERAAWDSKWIEINLDAIRHNYLAVRERVASSVKMLGVVKADAYGHGAVETARLLEDLGLDMLGVTTIQEGIELRRGGIVLPILVFAPFLPADMMTAIEHKLTVTVANFAAIEGLKKNLPSSAGVLKVHLKVETGMGRTGFWPEQIVRAAREMKELQGVLLEGIYSHLATAMWKDKTYARRQYGRFQEALADLERSGFHGLIRHICNSAGILELPEMHLDLVRTGTLLYGQYPHPRLEKSLRLQDPWSMQARVLYLHQLPPGHSVGYGRTYKTKGYTRVALLPVGFADGLQVEPILKPASFYEFLKGLAKSLLYYLGHPRVSPQVVFGTKKCPIIGKIGMQLTSVDVTALPEVEIGSVAGIPLRRTSASPLIPRVYLEEGKVKLISVRARQEYQEKEGAGF